MQTIWWRLRALAPLLWLVFLTGPPAHASSLQSGIHGLAWGGHIGDYPHLEKVREDGAASYYVDRNTVYHAVGQPVTGVIYGFYRDRLFAAYIKMSTPNQAYYLEKHFETEYGPARVTAAGKGRTIYRWEDGDLKVKLKVDEAGDDIKLGMYYQPLSADLNQAQAEEGPSDGFGRPPSEGRSARSAPLF